MEQFVFRPVAPWLRISDDALKGDEMLLLIIILLLLFGGGGGYYAHRSYGGRGLGGVLGVVLIVIIVLWLFGGLAGTGHI